MNSLKRKLSRREFLRLGLWAGAVIRFPLILAWHPWQLDSGACLDCGKVIG